MKKACNKKAPYGANGDLNGVFQPVNEPGFAEKSIAQQVLQVICS